MNRADRRASARGHGPWRPDPLSRRIRKQCPLCGEPVEWYRGDDFARRFGPPCMAEGVAQLLVGEDGREVDMRTLDVWTCSDERCDGMGILSSPEWS